ncbi:MAG TPA: type I polyketide synthase, partial [Longimicrobiaceae bacterium]|nr:type I polyketide synthase [Longimicrobiaceae bacterium]
MAEHLTAEEIRDWLAAELAARLQVERSRIDVRERFSRYGLKSAEATRLLADLSRMLDRPLPPTLVWDHPTPEALARHLAGEGAATAPREPRAEPAAADEPVAVVGMACRFPGADSPEAFWRLLRDGVDAVREVPAERWDADALYDPDPAVPGKMSTRWGGFLDRVDAFDAAFFGISPREAERMDPQQRLMLELAWEALEDAGIPAPSLQGSTAGVFLGAIWNDYGTLDRRRGTAGITEHSATGSHYSLIANRISYQLGLRGPSLVVDTACSASLVAVHLACQALRSGEATLALAGGVNLIVAPDSTVAMSKFGAMAPDGRSKAFDARANGYVRGEGGGVVVLKPLSRALADGDPVWCVIRGSAVNNDGASNGLTAPNPRAQVEVLEEAYRRAGIDPARVDYVEAHGTGTMLGDPIEAGALGTVLGTGRDPERPLLLGSVKTNVGHLEAAAGIAGLVKAALAIRHREIPPSLHFENPNPHIAFDALRLRVNRALSPWPGGGEPARAGVSSFGFGGTNAHVVLEEVPERRARLVLFAAPDADALRARVAAVAEAMD